MVNLNYSLFRDSHPPNFLLLVRGALRMLKKIFKGFFAENLCLGIVKNSKEK